jgi:hypothetical protein
VTAALSLRTRETVATETPASSATSLTPATGTSWRDDRVNDYMLCL